MEIPRFSDEKLGVTEKMKTKLLTLLLLILISFSTPVYANKNVTNVYVEKNYYIDKSVTIIKQCNETLTEIENLQTEINNVYSSLVTRINQLSQQVNNQEIINKLTLLNDTLRNEISNTNNIVNILSNKLATHSTIISKLQSENVEITESIESLSSEIGTTVNEIANLYDKINLLENSFDDFMTNYDEIITKIDVLTQSDEEYEYFMMQMVAWSNDVGDRIFELQNSTYTIFDELTEFRIKIDSHEDAINTVLNSVSYAHRQITELRQELYNLKIMITAGLIFGMVAFVLLVSGYVSLNQRIEKLEGKVNGEQTES